MKMETKYFPPSEAADAMLEWHNRLMLFGFCAARQVNGGGIELLGFDDLVVGSGYGPQFVCRDGDGDLVHATAAGQTKLNIP